MGRARPPANGRGLRQRIGLSHRGACALCVPLVTPGASEEKSCAPVPPSSKRIHTNGWPRLEILAQARTGQNCIGQWRPSKAIGSVHCHPKERALLLMSGQYGTGAVLSEPFGLAYVMRGKDYQLLKRAEVQARLHLPPDQHLTHLESGICRALYDCPDLALGPIAQNPAGS
jgi:hypothetical protein